MALRGVVGLQRGAVTRTHADFIIIFLMINQVLSKICLADS